MNRAGNNASWKRLKPGERKKLDQWLFEENLSCEQTLPKAQAELGYKGSASSLRRYYRRRLHERTLLEFKELRTEVAKLAKAPLDAGALRTASMKLLASYLYQQVLESPENVKEWGRVAELILQNDHTEAFREIKDEEHRIRREAMAFAKEKFQFNTVEEAYKALPQLLQLREAKMDPNIKRYEENAQWNRVRREIFGPGIDVHPESAEEEAEMLAAKRKRDAQEGIEVDEEEDRVIDAQPPLPSSPYYKDYMEEEAKEEGGENVQ